MCMLCGDSQKEGREGMAYRAKQLRELSYRFDHLGAMGRRRLYGALRLQNCHA